MIDMTNIQIIDQIMFDSGKQKPYSEKPCKERCSRWKSSSVVEELVKLFKLFISLFKFNLFRFNNYFSNYLFNIQWFIVDN
jgi:hypothetical protein